MKTSTKIISALLVGGVLLGASALPPLSADYKLQGQVEELLLSDPDIVDATVHIHKNGKVFLDYEDKFINQAEYTCQEDMKQRETELWDVVAEATGVDVRDIHSFTKGELNVAIADRESFLEEITQVKPFHQYDLSPQDWEYLMNRVEQGQANIAPVSEEAQLYWDTWYELERTPLSWATISSHIGEVTTAEMTTTLPLFQEIGSGSITYTWYYGEDDAPRCVTTFDHLDSDGTVLSYDFGETYEIAEEPPLFAVD